MLTLTLERISHLILMAFLLLLPGLSLSQTVKRQPSTPVRPIVDPYSSWIELKPEHDGFVALVPEQPKYSKTYSEDSTTHVYIGTLDQTEKVKYVILYRNFDYVIGFSPLQFIRDGALKELPNAKVVRTVPITVNGVKGIEAIVVLNEDENSKYAQMVCFISGAEVYLVSFDGPTLHRVLSQRTEYFLKHFKMSPTAIARPSEIPPPPRRSSKP